MNEQTFSNVCKATIANYFNSHVGKTDKKIITVDDVYMVWFCKTLQNTKGLFSTTVSDGMYYEMTYNGDKNELYFDAYKKWENMKIDIAPDGLIL